jgi:hypothetical protein
MVKKIIFGILVIFTSSAFGQGFYTDQTAPQPDSTTIDVTEPEFNPKEIGDFIQKNKVRVNVEVGTTFGTTFGNGSYFGTYVSPHISIPVSKRFSLQTGGYLLNSQALSNNGEEGFYNPYNPFSNGMTRTFLYVEGAYMLTENLTLTGAVYKEFNMFNKPPPGINSGDFDYEGIIMGVDYKIGENVFIHGQIEFSNGRSPYYYSPFGRSMGVGRSSRMDPFYPGF